MVSKNKTCKTSNTPYKLRDPFRDAWRRARNPKGGRAPSWGGLWHSETFRRAEGSLPQTGGAFKVLTTCHQKYLMERAATFQYGNTAAPKASDDLMRRK